MELDFSKLDTISYRGFDGEEARAQKDALIEQGWTIVEAAETPFKGVEAQSVNKTTPSLRRPLERKLEPFTGIDTSRDYRAMYRAACNYHQRHDPPKVDKAYWKNHTPGQDEPPKLELDYWAEAVQDMSDTATSFQQDPFLKGVLMAVYEELEREYKARRNAALDRR